MKYSARGSDALRRTEICYAAQELGMKNIPVLPIHRVVDGYCSCGKLDCASPGKHPRTKHGVYDATTEADAIEDWWATYPDANAASRTGQASGRVVLDFDSKAALLKAIELGLPDDTETDWVRTLCDYHVYFEAPDEPLRSRVLHLGYGLKVELKAEAACVLAPPSFHPSGKRYRRIPSLTGKLAPLPPWALALYEEQEHEQRAATGAAHDPSLEGPPIFLHDRNNSLTRIAGWLHDGHRDLTQLTRDLMAVNVARCTPPLPKKEVHNIARKMIKRPPCRPSVNVTSEVLRVVTSLEQAAKNRKVSGVAAGSNWATYRALLDLAKQHGRQHERGIELSVSVRQIALTAGKGKSAASRSLERLEKKGLVRRSSKGHGTNSGSVVLVSTGVQLGHPTPLWGPSPSLPSALGGDGCPAQTPSSLYRLRWGRLGPISGVVLERIAENPGIKREELARLMQRKPDSLKKPLRTLVKAGLIERVLQGRYRLVDNFAEVLEKRLEEDGSNEIDRLDRAEYKRQSDAWAEHLAEKHFTKLAQSKRECEG